MVVEFIPKERVTIVLCVRSEIVPPGSKDFLCRDEVWKKMGACSGDFAVRRGAGNRLRSWAGKFKVRRAFRPDEEGDVREKKAGVVFGGRAQMWHHGIESLPGAASRCVHGAEGDAFLRSRPLLWRAVLPA